tara:strand:+ start:978 stop:1091 length:114 start_codon:yes stop_codon:yes gene_type:complete
MPKDARQMTKTLKFMTSEYFSDVIEPAILKRLYGLND